MKSKILLAMLIVGCGGAEVASDIYLGDALGAVGTVGTDGGCFRPDGGALVAKGRFIGGRTVTGVVLDPQCVGINVSQFYGDDLPLGDTYCTAGSCHQTIQVGCNVTVTHTLNQPNPLGEYQIIRTGTLTDLPDGGMRLEGSAIATGSGQFCPRVEYSAYLEKAGQ